MTNTAAPSASRIRSAQLQTLYAYWRAKLAGRRMPARGDINPVELPPSLLPNVMLLDLEESEAGLQIRFRLTGTSIDDALGHNPTGDRLANVVSNTRYIEYLKTLYADLMRAAAPIYSENLFRLAGQAVPMLAKRLSLPLSTDGRRCDMALVGAIFEYPRTEDVRYGRTLDDFSETVRDLLAD